MRYQTLPHYSTVRKISAAMSLRLKKSTTFTLMVALVTSAIFASGPIHTQVVSAQADNDPCRFLSVKIWVGSFTLTGSGGGHGSGLTWTYNQSVSGSFTVTAPDMPIFQCGGKDWTGGFMETVSINDTITNDNGDKTTYQGSGQLSEPPPTPGVPTSQLGSVLSINAQNNKYLFGVDSAFPVKVISSTGDIKDGMRNWGPSALPDGRQILAGLPIWDIPLPASGITLSGQLNYTDTGASLPGQWHVTWTMTCDNSQNQLQVSPLYQNVLPWRPHKIFKSDKTIWAAGCALTSLAMALNFAYKHDSFNPDSLNDLLKASNTGFVGPNLIFDVATRKASANVQKFHEFRDGSAGDIEDALCLGVPAIVRVDVPRSISPHGGQHYVLVTGKQGSTFTINDPAFGQTTLASYPSFKARGYVAPYSGNFPVPAQGRQPSARATVATANNGSLTIAADNNVELLVIDPSGQRTGFVPTSGAVVEEIPGSVYFSDELANVETGDPPVDTGHQLQIDTPAAGTYQVIVTTRQPGPFTIAVNPFSQDGTPQTPTLIQGTALQGSSSFPIQYVPTPGSNSTIGTPSCAWASGLSVPFTPAGGTGTIEISAPAGCAWNAVSNAGWITITSDGSGNGNGQVGYQVSPSSSSRAGTITVANQAFGFNQSGTVSAPLFQFSLPNYNVSEGGGSDIITVTRSGDVSNAATVDYTTVDNTAFQRSDYTLAVGTLKFAAGEASKNLTILVTDDAYFQGDKTLNIVLSNPSGAGLSSPSTATVTILDNDSSTPTTNPLDNADARFFVRQHYYDFLSREPDPAGLDYWSSQITQCGSDQSCVREKRVDVSNAFFYEPEFQQTGAYVYRLYRAAFGNDQPFPNPDPGNPVEAKKIPSYDAFVRDRARVIAGTNQAQTQLDLANLFVQRPEFLAKYPAALSGSDFVDALLARIMNDSGVDLRSQRSAMISLFNQAGRGAVLYRLANDNLQTNPITNRTFIDAEYNRSFVYTQYAGYLRRDSDIGGFLFWLGKVNAFPVRDADIQHVMVCAFITSREYQERFSSVVTRSNADCGP